MPRIRNLDRAEKSIAVRVTEQLHDALFRQIARWERKQEKSIDEY